MKTFQDYLHIMDFIAIGNQMVQGQGKKKVPPEEEEFWSADQSKRVTSSELV